MAIDKKTTMNVVRMGGATLSGTTPSNTSLVDMQGFEALTVLLTTGTVTDAGFDAPTRKPHGKAMGIMIPAIASLGGGSTAEFATPPN